MKKLLLFLLTTLFGMVPALAQTTFVDDGINYEVWQEAWEESPGVWQPGSVRVISCESGKTEINIPAQVIYTHTYNVTEIKEQAFKGCTEITSVTIPNSVTAINWEAFSGCEKLTSITIPNSVTWIGNNAFSGCESLTSINIPESVVTLDGGAFSGCSSLTDVTLSSKITSIGWSSFQNCTSLTSITIPNGVTEIGGSAFMGCTSLSSIEIPTSVNKICNSAFSNCESLTSITIPANVKTIESSAFSGCTSLTSVEIPDGVKTIYNNTFWNCTSLSSITIPSSVTKIEGNAFCNCESLTSLVIPDNVTSIGDKTTGGSTFQNCSKLTSVTLSNQLKSLPDWAFANCTSLTSITIPNSVTSIGEYAFNGCNKLETVTIPSGVTEIKGWVFQGCTALKLVTSEIATPFEVENIFDWSSYEGALVVPKNSRSAYRSVNGWKEFAVIFEVGETICDIEQTDEQGIVYKLKQAEDNSLYFTVANHTEALKAEIVIPALFGGYPVKSIEYGAFSGCTNLTAVTIPNSVTSIGNDAFSGCENIKVVTIDIATPITIDMSVFAWWYYKASLVVPEGSRAAYKAADGWKDFAFILEEGEPLYDVPVERTDEQGLTYRLKQADDNSVYYAVTGRTDAMKAKTEIVVPAELDGCPVRSVEGWDIFRECPNLTTVTFLNDLKFTDTPFNECSSMNDVYVYVWDDTEFCNNHILGALPNKIGYSDGTNWTEKSYTIHLLKKDDEGIETEVTDFVVPEGVTTIGDGAFKGLVSLSSITIPNSVTSIGDNAFRGCTNLLTVKMGKKVSSIGDYAFYNCTSLESITLSKELESIGNYAFSGEWFEIDYKYHGCPLTSIAIPGTVKTIGNGAFRYCYGLAAVSFGKLEEDEEGGLISIGDNAFSECSFTSIALPASVISIGTEAFAYNNNLTTVTLGEALKEIKDKAFMNCGSLASIAIPDGVTSIGSRAFGGCYNLISVRMPQSLTTMGENVFDGCPIKSIDLPDGFTTIPANLFQNNDLEYIKLGNNVKSIGKNAFGSKLEGDEALVVIEIGTSTPPTIASDAFPNIDLSVINVIVPTAAAQSAYQKANVWKDMTYANMETDVEVTVDVPGDLGIEVLEDCGVSAPKVVGLKVKGAINADDFVQLKSNFKSLLRLDLSECDITEIPDGALQGKTQLQELTLPTKLQTIGRSAFQGCPYLTGKLDLPAGVTSIGNSAFEGTYYTSVALPRSLTSIGDSAFYNLPIKQKLMIPEGMTSIGAYAFADTYVYDHITIPDGVAKLGDGAFRNTQITSVFLPTGITSLNWAVFQGCSNLDEALYIPDNVTSMYGYAFDGCSALKNIRLSANLTSMGEYALQNTNVEYINVPSKVRVLSQGVLKNSKSLESLALPAYLKTVGAEALYGCSGLRNLSVEAVEPPTAEKTSFIGVNTDQCIISIPTEAYRSYLRAEYWGQFVQMRNDIAVETEGNGQIAFEAVVEGEEEASMARAKARVQRFTAARRANTRGASGETESELTYANNGSSVYVPKNGQVNFLIIPAEGEMLVSAFLDGEDITSSIVDGVYTATADKKDGKLVVKFSGESQEEGETEFIRISAAGQVPFCSSFDLDFTDKPELKAYVATGYDKAKGTIWLTRVKQVPAETGFLLIGAAGDYNIPISLSAADVYYKNMFKGTLEGTTIYENEWTDRGYTNYYLSKGASGVGFYKVTNPAGQAIGANRAYLPIPMDIWPNGGEGSTETITVSAAKQVPYYTNSWSALDFTSLEAQGVKAYTATGYNYKTGTIWLSRVKKVPGNTGILVMAEEAGEYEVPTVQVELYYENMFRGSETAQTIYTNETIDGVDYVNYYLSKGTAGVGFYKVTDEAGVKMGANRCYLPIPKRDSASGARGKNAEDSFCNMVISDNDDDVIAIPVFGGMNGEDDGSTGISTQFQDAEPDAYYNLQGQRVENPGKGVFIKNGRKVVIK